MTKPEANIDKLEEKISELEEKVRDQYLLINDRIDEAFFIIKEIDKKLMRPAEVDTLLADSSKAKKILKWEPRISFDELIANMVEHDLENLGKF